METAGEKQSRRSGRIRCLAWCTEGPSPADARRLLDDHAAPWFAKTDARRDEFHGTVIKPFNARLTKPLISTSRKCCGLAVEVGGFTIEERDDRAVTVKTTGTILDAACA